MIGALANHLWQSTVFVLAAALLAWALRRNGAHIRHGIWMVASIKFLLPFSILLNAGSLLPRIGPADSPASAAVDPGRELSDVVDWLARPFAQPGTLITAAPASPPPVTTDWLPLALAGVWASGFLIIVRLRLRGWQRIRAAVRSSSLLAVSGPVPVRSAPGLTEPGVVGIRHPVVLVPERIEERLTPPQFRAVLEHELCHVRRRDNLTSALHMIVEAISGSIRWSGSSAPG
jgi:beta-lactamase regulating signal transducer with metallopeptidase domain